MVYIKQTHVFFYFKMNAFQKSLEECGGDVAKDLRTSVNRSLMRQNCLFIFDFTCPSKTKTQVKKVYIYKTPDNHVYVDFINETTEKGVLFRYG